jgi:predicted dinucleotide-binding enzyme
VLIDIANPLDLSQGIPPFLLVSNTDSLGEQIQRALPRVKVVKALDTMNEFVMADPSFVAAGEHTVFVSGNDEQAKARVTEILRSFGWRHVLDLGDVTTARGTEMYLPCGSGSGGARNRQFNIAVVQ